MGKKRRPAYPKTVIANPWAVVSGRENGVRHQTGPGTEEVWDHDPRTQTLTSSQC